MTEQKITINIKNKLVQNAPTQTDIAALKELKRKQKPTHTMQIGAYNADTSNTIVLFYFK